MEEADTAYVGIMQLRQFGTDPFQPIKVAGSKNGNTVDGRSSTCWQDAG